MMRGGTAFIMAEARRRELLHDEVCELVPKRISEREVKAHFKKMSVRYLRLHDAEEIVEDMELAHRFKQQVGGGNPLAPAFSTHHDKDRGCTVVKVCSWDRGGLFGNIAGCLSAAGLNILTAQIFTRTDGIVFDTFSIVDGITGALARTEDVERFEKLLERLLTGKKVDLEDLIHRQKSARTPYQAYTGEQIHTEVRIDNDSSDTRTVIEVETEDRVGLLHQLSRTLHQLQLYISAALICTEKGGVIDIFYVREYDGKKLTSKTRQEQVVSELEQAVERLGKRK
jgi:[protein-PII] uridylyltransferase